MDRFVIREPRANADYPQGNQMIAFSSNVGGNNMVPPENMYYPGNYAYEFPNNMQRMVSSPYIPVSHMNSPTIYAQTNSGPSQAQGQIMSGIDPRYLASYSDNNAQFIVTGQQVQNMPGSVPPPSKFGTGNHSSNFIGVNRNNSKTFTPHFVAQETPKQNDTTKGNVYNITNKADTRESQWNTAPTKKENDIEISKNEKQNQIVTRADTLKALYKSGQRAFSGPVEKVLKWHKSLQDIGILILYEVVAKCISIRDGESCAKYLVVRDENGPAMQVVYYEVDFLLPALKPPCTIRVVGRMMPRTCRLQAFNVRPATGDDVAMLPRRAAIAAQHVAKLCKEYGSSS